MSTSRCLVLLALVAAVQCVQIHVRNVHPDTLWIGIQGNADDNHLRNGGFVMKSGENATLEADNAWGGRFWARTHCDPETNTCQTGDCDRSLECKGKFGLDPSSSADLTLNASGHDIYGITLAFGFNVKLSIEPIGGQSNGSRTSCGKSECAASINEHCPTEFKLLAKSSSEVIGCKSACDIYETEELCCLGSFRTEEACKTSESGKFFKSQCPDVATTEFDYTAFTCLATQYLIVFG